MLRLYEILIIFTVLKDHSIFYGHVTVFLGHKNLRVNSLIRLFYSAFRNHVYAI